MSRSNKVPKKRYCPDLVEEMAECDQNYLRLVKLFPDMRSRDRIEFGIQTQTDDGALLGLRVVERCRYTTILSVYVLGEEDYPWMDWPSMQVRVYHDLRSAEVVSVNKHRNFAGRYEYPNKNMYQPNEKSQLNHFLGELLSHCLANGHSLAPINLDFLR